MQGTRTAPTRTFPPWRSIAVVLLGGTVGTALREGMTLAVPRIDGVPIATVGVNVAGAFALGVLLEHLARRGPESGRARDLRLLLGTGVLGGFTTYSALAVDTVLLASGGSVGIAVLYALGTLVLGGVASWAGIAVAAGRAGRRP